MKQVQQIISLQHQMTLIYQKNGTHVTFKGTKEQGSVSFSLCEIWSSSKDFYYEAKMTGSNNSVAVGLIPYEIHAERFGEEFIGDNNDLEQWTVNIMSWDLIVSHYWPWNASYTYHGDTGKVWHCVIGSSGGDYLKVGDTVGFGIDGNKRELFWTINDTKLEAAFILKDSSHFHPHIAFKGDGGQLELNLGKEPFLYKKNAAPTKVFPVPESFSEEWIKSIGNNEELPHTLMHDNLKDVKILSKDGVEIKCHGIILATRSPVLRAMMDPANNGGNTIAIKDFDAITISKMLWFMYSDKVKPKNIDMELLGISNMYQVEALQIVCEKRLCTELEVKNVLDAWTGAHMFKRDIFLGICEDFIISKWDEVQKTDSFANALRDHPDVIATLAIKIVNCIKTSK